ncbi:GGDEF domain-containing protein [Thermithiobacillus plumbiphilus]|uniref:diguanylate cyclase n=1 Tax=Thermithiobacillus plumbiphilus TaxID=1729899 RepID=A0ABU9DAA5_9PROT
MSETFPLLHWHLVVEPDLQRLSCLLMETGQELGCPTLPLAERVLALMPLLREELQGQGPPLAVHLLAQAQGCVLRFGEPDRVFRLLAFIQPPATEQLSVLRERLRHKTERTDPELLRRQNEAIAARLEEARQRAEQELRAMEQVLESKQRALSETLHRAEHDALTGLYNRGAFDLHLDHAFRRARRQQEPLTLLFLDLDMFKQVNDTHGHAYGDQWLCRMADTMRAAIRLDVDEAFRFGGDEFALLIFADKGIAERAAGRILSGMDGLVSIGIASLRDSDIDPKQFTARADAALYEAKRQGRGRYRHAP